MVGVDTSQLAVDAGSEFAHQRAVVEHDLDVHGLQQCPGGLVDDARHLSCAPCLLADSATAGGCRRWLQVGWGQIDWVQAGGDGHVDTAGEPAHGLQGVGGNVLGGCDCAVSGVFDTSGQASGEHVTDPRHFL